MTIILGKKKVTAPYKGIQTYYQEVEEIIPFDTICNNHNEVVHLLQRFKKTGNIQYVNQAIDLVRVCKKQGQRMENRLRKYFDAFTSLSFKRVRKSKGRKD